VPNETANVNLPGPNSANNFQRRVKKPRPDFPFASFLIGLVSEPALPVRPKYSVYRTRLGGGIERIGGS
jgi:hypothetical protein